MLYRMGLHQSEIEKAISLTKVSGFNLADEKTDVELDQKFLCLPCQREEIEKRPEKACQFVCLVCVCLTFALLASLNWPW